MVFPGPGPLLAHSLTNGVMAVASTAVGPLPQSLAFSRPPSLQAPRRSAV